MKRVSVGVSNGTNKGSDEVEQYVEGFLNVKKCCLLLKRLSRVNMLVPPDFAVKQQPSLKLLPLNIGFLEFNQRLVNFS